MNYGDEKGKVQGSPEKPQRAGNVWYIDQTDSVNNTTDTGEELFLLTEHVVGSWEKAVGLEDYQKVYVPRPANWPPIQRVTLKYLDSDGSMQEVPRRDRDAR